ncbi:MAG: lipopolysaccharide heptosyltransferase I [Gammaproteobacteria bacterium]|nr:lipopolysaccharide heptosyltransferase I [Gammaproteobacteria bacterium]
MKVLKKMKQQNNDATHFKILLIKLSSLGDIIHVFPALTELLKHHPEAEVTWVVDQPFAEVPLWHPAVKKVIVAPLRDLKKQGWGLKAFSTLKNLITAIRAEQYDFVIDAQGLFKSAMLARLAKGYRVGFGRGCLRENVWWLYQHWVFIPFKEHAIKRVKALFSEVGKYVSMPEIQYGLEKWTPVKNKVILFAHGTTWASKHYPDPLWKKLAECVTAAGYEVWLAHTNAHELKRAEWLKVNDQVKVLPKMSLNQIKAALLKVSGVIAVDTGLAHISAALSIPCVTLYGPTDPSKIGTMGEHQKQLQAVFECAPCGNRQCTHADALKTIRPPCFKTLPPSEVWKALQELLS